MEAKSSIQLCEGVRHGRLSWHLEQYYRWACGLAITKVDNLLSFGEELSLDLLTKDRKFFLAFVLLSFVSGFAILSIRLFKLVQGLLVEVPSPWWSLALIIAGILLIDYLVIRSLLRTKYALTRQGVAASLLILGCLIIAAGFGFYLRVDLEGLTTAAVTLDCSCVRQMELLDCGCSEVTREAIPSPISSVAILITTASTVSIFGFVYSLAAGTYSKADYGQFYYWLRKFFDGISVASVQQATKPFDHALASSIANAVNEAIEALEATLAYETPAYSEFATEELYDPLLKLREFTKRKDVTEQPKLLLELVAKEEEVRHDWVVDQGYHAAYESLAKLTGLG